MARGSVEEQRFDFGTEESDAAQDVGTALDPSEKVDAKSAVLSAAELRLRVDSLRMAARQSSGSAPALEVSEARKVVLGSPAKKVMTLDRDEVEDLAPMDDFVGQAEPPEEAPDAESLSIAQFYERMRLALAGAFSDEVWVVGEIRSVKDSRGHHYLELADHGAPASGRDAGETLEVVCWARDWPRVARALAAVDLGLEVGQVVRVRGRVSVWGGRIRFTLKALDIEALLGQIAQARRVLLHALQAEGLLEANKKWRVPAVPLRIGLVTSHSSEAHRDFMGQLEGSGFAFQVRLEASFVQGADAPGQLAAALRRLETFEPDLAVIVRGGGARGDLAAFDAEEVARAVANASFPIWVGIGHTGDRSVVDEIAHSSFITPTACGEAIVARVSGYWTEIQRKTNVLRSLALARLEVAEQRLSDAEKTIVRGTRHQLVVHATDLNAARARVARSASSRVRDERSRLRDRTRQLVLSSHRSIDVSAASAERCSQVLRAYDPQRQLARGWTLTKDADGQIVKSVSGLSVGALLTTRFADGEAHSVIGSVDHSAETDARPEQESNDRS